MKKALMISANDFMSISNLMSLKIFDEHYNFDYFRRICLVT